MAAQVAGRAPKRLLARYRKKLDLWPQSRVGRDRAVRLASGVARRPDRGPERRVWPCARQGSLAFRACGPVPCPGIQCAPPSWRRWRHSPGSRRASALTCL